MGAEGCQGMLRARPSAKQIYIFMCRTDWRMTIDTLNIPPNYPNIPDGPAEIIKYAPNVHRKSDHGRIKEPLKH